MNSEVIETHQKTLRINLDEAKYGTFAEIGAGQEVARWFFQVGGAAGTIAKTISAYDMNVSDAIYGPTQIYVSRHRLQTMLEYEYELLTERLKEKRGSSTRFFVFADTVAARSYRGTGDCHGWMGVRFQTEPCGIPSQIIIHVRMSDRENVQQQEAIGIIGVNLVYGAQYYHADPHRLLLSLLDNLTLERVEVDMIKYSGPAFAGVDNRLMSLALVQQGLSNAAMFTSDGEVVQASEVLHKRPILVERGSFRPVTNVTLDMLHCAQEQFLKEPDVQGQDVVVLMEITLHNLSDPNGTIDHRDFLDRVDLLGALGKTVLISNYGRYFALANYLFRYTRKRIAIALGLPSLKNIFEPRHYADLDGGILESFGRMFKNDLRLYVYPQRDSGTGAVTTVDTFQVEPGLRHLYAHLLENHSIEPLKHYNESYLPITSREVLARLRAGDPSWETMVPTEVARMIKERQLFRAPGSALAGATPS